MKRDLSHSKKRAKVTKRVGHYIEDILKINKSIPAPNPYTIKLKSTKIFKSASFEKIKFHRTNI